MEQNTVTLSLKDTDTVNTVLSGPAALLSPGHSIRYTYAVYFGPKRLSTLKAAGHQLDRIVNFGWWDFIAKPTLYLLNFLYGYVHNYGIAIILVTVIIKLLFWPIAQKGMKSMKTMQKLQPKMAKLREKYKDDKERLNQEMMQLYKTYKVNPVGGCLPMVLQIPVFFALYRVLLQTIELRHAPFMLWINDLSAPDRLHIGINIPYLGGIPVLTLLMGASMFLQQKMTPTHRGSHPGKNHDVSPGGLYLHVPELCLWPGPLLVCQQSALHCPAVLYQSSGGGLRVKKPAYDRGRCHDQA